jgi:hypothetical protein
MPRGRPNGFGARLPGVLALGWALLLAAPCGAAAESDVLAPDPLAVAFASPISGDRGGRERPWISVGLLAGSTQFDAGLADYHWDITPRPGWGLRALAGRRRLAAGLRVWRASSSQSIGDLGPAPHVRATSWELIGEGRLAERWGTQVLATAGAGRLRIGYDPDRITLQPPGPVSPIVVAMAPVGAWIWGGGFALRREVTAGWTMGLGVDARVFAIDTAHRAGGAIVVARESFGDWSARFEFARRFGRE